MFAASASGVLLPAYVCYKAVNMQEAWREQGLKGARHNRTPSGWFTTEIFQDWFCTVAVPCFCRLEGQKILIGDNLCSHVNFDIIKTATEEGIEFVFLPPNATHYCQPLDVAVFKAIKSSWSSVLSPFKKKYRGTLPKPYFPRMLKETIEKTKNLEQDIISGFRASGIFPFDPVVVPSKIPDKSDERQCYLQPILNLLHKNWFVYPPLFPEVHVCTCSPSFLGLVFPFISSVALV